MIRCSAAVAAAFLLLSAPAVAQVEMDVEGSWALAQHTDAATGETRVAAFNRAEDRYGEPTEDLLMVACAGDEVALTLLAASFDPGRAVARVVHRFDGGPAVESTWLVVEMNDGLGLRFVDLELLARFVDAARLATDLILEIRARGRETRLWFELRGTEDAFHHLSCIPSASPS